VRTRAKGAPLGKIARVDIRQVEGRLHRQGKSQRFVPASNG
jgi:hypothetical protein